MSTRLRTLAYSGDDQSPNHSLSADTVKSCCRARVGFHHEVRSWSERPAPKNRAKRKRTSVRARAIGKSKRRITLESSTQSLPALPTRRCFPYEDRRVIWAPTLAPKVGAFSFSWTLAPTLLCWLGEWCWPNIGHRCLLVVDNEVLAKDWRERAATHRRRCLRPKGRNRHQRQADWASDHRSRVRGTILRARPTLCVTDGSRLCSPCQAPQRSKSRRMG